MTTKIPLTKGFTALVSQEDAALAGFKWCANVMHKSKRHVYGFRQCSGSATYLHHAVMGKPAPGFVVDHINGDTLDNRRENLRFVTPAENNQNITTPPRASSGFRNVQRHRDGFVAKISRNKRRIYIGIYKTAEEGAEAVAAYLSAQAMQAAHINVGVMGE